MDTGYVVIPPNDILHLIGIDTGMNRGKKIMVNCPFCHHKNLSLNTETGQVKCWSATCGYRGNAMTLYKDVRGLSSNSEAYQEIKRELNITDDKSIEKVKRKQEQIKAQKKIAASLLPPEKLDSTYREFLDRLSLKEGHYIDLVTRGISEADIQAGYYRSVPSLNDNYAVTTAILEAGCDVEGVPGFYKDWNNHWTFRKLSAGILVPYRNEHDQIVGLQIRVDEDARYEDKDGKKSYKYYWVSSDGYECGCGSGSPAHWAVDYYWDAEKFVPMLAQNRRIGLTEGALKGDAFHSLTGTPCICVAGVTCYTAAKSALEKAWEIGYRTLLLLFDMDSESNENVMVALDTMKKMAEEIGYKVRRPVWNRLFKGIDDYYNAKKSGEATFEAVCFDGTCEVCKNSKKVVLCNSRTGNEPHLYCADCFRDGLEPYKVIKTYVVKKMKEGKKYPEEIPDLQREIIDRSLKSAGIKEEDFLKDLHRQ